MSNGARFEEVLASMNNQNSVSISTFPTREVWDWKRTDETTKYYASRLAETLISSNKPVALIGDPGVGKRHLLNVVATAEEHWESTIGELPRLYDLTMPPGLEMAMTARTSLLESIAKTEKQLDGQARVVVSDLGTASLAELMDLSVIIVSECGKFYTQANANGGITRWSIIHSCEMEYPVEDLAEAIASDQRLANSPKYSQRYTANAPLEFIQAIGEFDEQLAPYDNGVSDVVPSPPGFWISAYRRAASRAATEELDSPAEVIEDLINELRDDLGVYPIGVEDDEPGILESIFGVPSPVKQREKKSSSDVEPLGDFTDLDKLKSVLKSNVLGQDNALDEVVDSLLAPAAGLNSNKKPLQTMLFLGPTGVGKTETALTLAKNAFEKEMNVIRLDMNEYADEHSRNKLFGAPPSYVGYGDGGVLTNAISENPQSLILLDEIEKAHASIWDQFLSIFDAGRMTDGSGNTHDFTQSIIIMTSNLGSTKMSQGQLGFNHSENNVRLDMHRAVQSAVKDYLKPEFINRIGVQVVFDKLSDESLNFVVRREIDLLRNDLKAKGHTLAAPRADIVRELAHQVNREYGARDVQRIVDRYIFRPVAHEIIENGGATGTKMKFRMKNKQIKIVND